MRNPFDNLLSLADSAVGLRLLSEYGSIFVTTATPPPVVLFTDETQVEAFQLSLAGKSAVVGEHRIELQQEAMDALLAAAGEAKQQGMAITARAADAGRRSYQDTVSLWLRNVSRGLEHWQSQGRIAPEIAKRIAMLRPVDQVEIILDLEDTQNIYFGTYFNRSILHSVAAPGASQHLSMLAFDVTEYEDETIEDILGRFGWYRTVVDDLPHFTYVGRSESELPMCGLRMVEKTYGSRIYRFWVPSVLP